ncbi:DMT family transporter [Nocardia sp. 2YAB30]|uniref:EamA family transporter n=1 Tax=unclassified Nocardia TaxID=2637762 RepID=UPI003F9B133D
MKAQFHNGTSQHAVGNLSAPVLILGGMVSIQLGAALAKHLFDIIGANATASVRIMLAGIIAMALWRPSLRIERRALPGIFGFGAATTGMNLCFYAAIDRIPLGMAVTIEFLGPLTVALAGSRRWRDTLWVLLAGAGVLLLTDSAGAVSWTGVLFALASAAGWGGYIVFSAIVGKHTAGHDGLALAMAVGGILATPMAFAHASPAVLEPLVLLGVLAVAVLSSLVPHAIEMTALRRISASTFGVLMSLEPAVAAGAGMLLLGEGLRLTQWAGVCLVVIAAAGAARISATPKAQDPQQSPTKQAVGFRQAPDLHEAWPWRGGGVSAEPGPLVRVSKSSLAALTPHDDSPQSR